MPSIYRESGLSRSPMFFHWTPFRLDFSSYRRNQELFAQMMPALIEQRQQQRSAIKDAKMPEMNGLANDQDPAYQAMLDAKATMVSRMSSGENPAWIASNDKEFQEAQQAYVNAISPTEDKRRKEHETSLDNYEKAIQSRVAKGENAGSFAYTDATGVPQLDPEDPTQFLSAGDYSQRRRHIPTYNLYGHGASMKADGALVSPQDVTERLDKLINTDALKEYGGPMGAQSQLDPMTNLVSIVQRSQKGHSNESQLQAGLDLAAKQLDSSAKLGLFNAYKDTDHFQKNRKKYLVDGKLDWNSVRQGMMGGSGFGKDNKMSFTNDFLMNLADKHLKKSNLVSESRSTIKNGKTGPGGSDPEMIPFNQYVGNGIPHKVMDPVTNTEVDPKRLMKKSQITVAIPTLNNGKPGLEGKVVDVYDMALPTSVKNSVKDDFLQLPKIEGSQQRLKFEFGDEEKFAKASEVASGSVAVTSGGRELTQEELENMRVIGGGDSYQFRPAVFGSDNVNMDDILNGLDRRIKFANRDSTTQTYTGPMLSLEGEGSSVFSETWIPVEVAVSDNGPTFKEYVPDNAVKQRTMELLGRSGEGMSMSIPLREQEVNTFLDQNVPTFERDNFDWGNWITSGVNPGDVQGTTTIFIRMPESWKFPNGKSDQLVNPERFMGILGNQDGGTAPSGGGGASVEDNIQEVYTTPPPQ